MPVFISKKVTGGAESLLKKILDLNIRITRRYTNSRYYEEIKGIADGAAGKVKAQDIERLNLFPELIKAACTVAGVWKQASESGQTLHVRALDWDSKNPISKFPMAIIYHPSDPKLHVHANFGWAGFIGSMTGISDRVSLGEKVWLPPKGSVKMTRYGNPWTYVFRDILYEANDIKSALDILTKTHRTCAIHIGLASSTDHSFRMFEYAETTLTNYDDTNYTHYAANHPKKSGLAYFDKHVQPSGDNCVGNVLTNVPSSLSRTTSMESGLLRSCTGYSGLPTRQEILSLQSSISRICLPIFPTAPVTARSRPTSAAPLRSTSLSSSSPSDSHPFIIINNK